MLKVEDAAKLIELLNNLEHLSAVPKLVEKVLKLEEQVYKNRTESVGEDYIPLHIISQKSGLSKRKLLELRTRGKLSFIRVNKNSIFIRRKDWDNFMNDHLVVADKRDSFNN